MVDNIKGIVDARILLTDKLENPEDYFEFSRLLGLVVSNERIEITSSSVKWLSDKYAQHGYPDNSRGGVDTLIYKDILKLFSKVSKVEFTMNTEVEKYIPETVHKPEYLLDYKEEINEIISNYFKWEFFFIVTNKVFWAKDKVFESINLSSPLLIHGEDLSDLESLLEGDKVCGLKNSVDKIKGMSPYVLGGQRDASVAERISIFCAVPVEKVVWIESEKSKGDRKLDSAIDGISNSENFVIIYTGKIGHSESGKMKKHCSKNGVNLIYSDNINYFCNDIINQLSSV